MNLERADHTGKVQHFFDRRVAAYDGFYDSPSAFSRWFSRVFRKAVYLRRDGTVQLAQRFQCRTLLDVGCGSGRTAVWFARNGIERITGIDVSEEMIALADELAERAEISDRCTFQVGDFLQMPTGQRFDMVAALGVFDYVRHPAEFLEHMSRFTDRVVYGSFPSWTLVRMPLRKIRYALRRCPTRFYRRREVAGLFEGLGFSTTGVEPVPGGWLGWAARES